MYPIANKFKYAMIRIGTDQSGKTRYIAKCVDNMVDEVEFMPYHDDPSLGIITVWYVIGCEPHNSKKIPDGGQAGCKWTATSFADFEIIVSSRIPIEQTLEKRLFAKRGDGVSVMRESGCEAEIRYISDKFVLLDSEHCHQRPVGAIIDCLFTGLANPSPRIPAREDDA